MKTEKNIATSYHPRFFRDNSILVVSDFLQCSRQILRIGAILTNKTWKKCLNYMKTGQKSHSPMARSNPPPPACKSYLHQVEIRPRISETYCYIRPGASPWHTCVCPAEIVICKQARNSVLASQVTYQLSYPSVQFCLRFIYFTLNLLCYI